MRDTESLTWLPTTPMRSPHVKVRGPHKLWPCPSFQPQNLMACPASGSQDSLFSKQIKHSPTSGPLLSGASAWNAVSPSLLHPHAVSLLVEILLIFESTNFTVSFVKHLLSRG